MLFEFTLAIVYGVSFIYNLNSSEARERRCTKQTKVVKVVDLERIVQSAKIKPNDSLNV